jgi:hypothetical protein
LQLSEAVVGYGSQARTDLTGSVATVTAKEIANTRFHLRNSFIQGKAAGVSSKQQQR